MEHLEEVRKNLKRNIREYRKKNNITQEELGELLCVSRVAVSYWESGRNMPDIGIVVALSRIFKVSLLELCGVVESQVTDIEAERELILLFRELNEEGKYKVKDRISELKQLGYVAEPTMQKNA